MPRYYFHILSQGQRVEDEEGTDLPDLDAARKEAITSAADLIADYSRSAAGLLPQSDAIEIADADGKQLAVIPLADILNGGGV
jgi:hypothetical protein